MTTNDSTTDQGGTRMVPVMDIVRKGSESNFRSHLIDLAMAGKLRVYIAVPDDKIVYTGNPNGRRQRTLPLAETQALRREILNHKKSGRTFIAFPMERRDIKYVVLDAAHAKAISDHGHAEIHWFSGGLTTHPDAALSRLGRVTNQPASSGIFCLRPYCFLQKHPRGFHSNNVPPLTLAPENVITVEFNDLFVVESDATELVCANEIQAAVQAIEPAYAHELRKRATGAVVLLDAALYFYATPGTPSISQKEMGNWLNENRKDFKKLFNVANAKLAYKFINTKHRFNQGANEGWQPTPFRGDILNSAREKYQCADYISDYLAVIFLASDRWAALLAEDKTDKVESSDKRMLRLIDEFRQELIQWGFSEKPARFAVADIVIWSLRVVRLKADIRGADEVTVNRANNLKATNRRQESR
jgi:hypothetical protein